MKNFFKNIWHNALMAAGVEKTFNKLNDKKVIILMYHGIIQDNANISCWWHLPITNFMWQMNYLKENFNVIQLKDFIDKIKNREKLPDHTAIITFDDGYENNYTLAFPVLRELQLPATIFLITDLIGSKNLLWWDELFLYTRDRNGYSNRIWCSDFFLSYFKRMSSSTKNRILSNLKSARFKNTALESDVHRQFSLLNWQQVDEMKASGLIEFGAHTCTHEILSQLSEEALNYEIRFSCSRIKQFSDVVPFAYPNGRPQDYNEKAKQLLKECNALCALTTQNGLNSLDQDLFDLKRIPIGNTISQSEFKLLCAGAFQL